jgi:hypothetical protein
MDTNAAAALARQMTVRPGTHEKAYSNAQVQTAWKMLSRGAKNGITRRDAEHLLRQFHPNLAPSNFEQIIGPIKGRLTYGELKALLQSDALPMV